MKQIVVSQRAAGRRVQGRFWVLVRDLEDSDSPPRKQFLVRATGRGVPLSRHTNPVARLPKKQKGFCVQRDQALRAGQPAMDGK